MDLGKAAGSMALRPWGSSVRDGEPGVQMGRHGSKTGKESMLCRAELPGTYDMVGSTFPEHGIISSSVLGQSGGVRGWHKESRKESGSRQDCVHRGNGQTVLG